MLRLFAWWFKMKGWKIGGFPANIKTGVMIAAPHTSNWDFVYALGALRIVGVKVSYLAKKELFKWPFSTLLKNTGGIPVERKKNYRLVDSIIEIFKQKDDLVLMISAEGTRTHVDKWKSGFYYIALGAEVPVYPAYLDYKTKTAGIGPAIWLTGNKEKDAEVIKQFYSGKTAKFPEHFNPEAIRFD